jgi:hypothetical protein
MGGRIRAFAMTIFGAVALLAFLAPSASAQFPQFQVSHFGADNDNSNGADLSAVSFNTKTNQYLVVYTAGSRATNDDQEHWNIFAQRVGINGATIGPAIPINAPTSNQLCEREPPSVAYGRRINEWMVVWDEGTATNCDDAIYAQRVGPNGNLVGPPSHQISSSGYEDIETNPIVYNSAADEFFVVWTAEGPGEDWQNLFGQRLTSTGTELNDDLPLTHFTGTDSSADDAVGVAYDSKDQRYLAVVRAVDMDITGNTQDEIFGHLMSTDGTPIGPDHFQISHVTATNPGSGDAFPPNVAYDPVNNRFLVAWTGNPQIGAMAADEYEVFAQLVGADGGVQAPSDLRISHFGPDGTSNFTPVRPRIAFNRFTRTYLLDWSGDNDTEGGVDNESEIWGQSVAADGSLVGPSDFRISHNGPDGDTNSAAGRPDLAFNPVSCQFMTTWHSGNLANQVGGNAEKLNIFGNTLPATSCPPPTITKQGKAKFKKGVVKSPISVTCPDIEDCSVALTAKVKAGSGKGGKKAGEAKKKRKKLTVASTSTTVPLGTTQKLSFRLTKRGSKLLRARGKLKLKVHVTATIGTGGPPVAKTFKVRIKAPKHKHHR